MELTAHHPFQEKPTCERELWLSIPTIRNMAYNPDAIDNDLHSDQRDVSAAVYSNAGPCRRRPNRVHGGCNSRIKCAKDVLASGSTEHRSQLKTSYRGINRTKGQAPRTFRGTWTPIVTKAALGSLLLGVLVIWAMRFRYIRKTKDWSNYAGKLRCSGSSRPGYLF
jgi:hypothetical protein